MPRKLIARKVNGNYLVEEVFLHWWKVKKHLKKARRQGLRLTKSKIDVFKTLLKVAIDNQQNHLLENRLLEALLEGNAKRVIFRRKEAFKIPMWENLLEQIEGGLDACLREECNVIKDIIAKENNLNGAFAVVVVLAPGVKTYIPAYYIK